jgi:hypothetical protein
VFSHFAAKELLNDMEMGYSWLHAPEFERKAPTDINTKADHIAMLWSMVSEWTSFVGVCSTDQTEQTSVIHNSGLNWRELNEPMRPRQRPQLVTSTRTLTNAKSRKDDEGPGPNSGGSRPAGGSCQWEKLV